MTEVKVALHDRREIEADIVLRDPRTDLAVLRLKGASNISAMEIGDSDDLQVATSCWPWAIPSAWGRR